jgi:hypothetical protein
MRNLLLILIFINILAFVYQRWVIQPKESVAPDFIAQDLPSLAAVPRAAPAGPETEPGPAASPETVPAPPAFRCLRVGPFPQEAAARQIRDALQQQSIATRQTTEEGQVWVGYWVQTAAQGSRAAADRARDALVKGGMPDVYVLPDSGDFRISLGVFRLRNSAERIIRQAEGLGIATRMVERYQPGTNFWLQVRVPGDAQGLPVDLRSDSGAILRTEGIDCAAAGI